MSPSVDTKRRLHRNIKRSGKAALPEEPTYLDCLNAQRFERFQRDLRQPVFLGGVVGAPHARAIAAPLRNVEIAARPV